MADKVLDVHSAFLRTHIRYMRRVREVATPEEYFRQYLGYDAPASEFSEYPLKLVFRIPSLVPADVMLVLKNPNISENWISGESPPREDQVLNEVLAHGSDHQQKVKALARVSAPHISNWFADHPGPQVQMKKLTKAALEAGYLSHDDTGVDPTSKHYFLPNVPINEITSRNSAPLNTATNNIAPVYDDFYVTELSKLRAPTGHWPFHQEESVIAKQYIRKEIKTVDPDLVIALGDRPSRVLREIAIQPLEKENLYKLSNVEHPRFLLTLPHPSYPGADYSPAKAAFDLIDS